ncbi:hypothetical protein T439DRAFT_383608 [Meredithblackwellia eburnea MCA 4105]
MNRIVKEETSGGASPASSLPSPSSSFTDYILRSSAPPFKTGWRQNLMKFQTLGNHVVDPASDAFIQPVKLNRKDPRTVRRLTEQDRERINKRAIAKAAGMEGMEVDSNGIEVKAEDGAGGEGAEADSSKPQRKEREQMDLSLVGVGKSGKTPVVRTKNNMFKKKIRRVFVSSEESRRLKREEWMPWVLEDDEGNERWVGALEGGAGERAPPPSGTRAGDANRNGTGTQGWRPDDNTVESGGGASNYVAFVFGESGDAFDVYPIHRWYKFSRGPRYATLSTEEADAEWTRQQKNQDSESRWMMHKRTNAAAGKSSSAPGSGTATPVQQPSGSSKGKQTASNDSAASVRSRMLDKSALSGRRNVGEAGGGGGALKKLRSVFKDSTGGYGDDELGRRRRKSGGGEQGDDEFEFEEDFQDDEEGVAKIDDMADEQETKELEERIKREMRAAKPFEEVADMDDDDEDENELTNTGKAVKKLVRKLDKTQSYDSDDDLFTDSDVDDDNASVASQDQTREGRSASGTPGLQRSSSSRPSQHGRTNSNTSRHASRAGSRSGSPVPSGSGSAVVAMRATSPSGGRKSTPGSRAGSPGPGGKRKRPDDEGDGQKRRKNVTPPTDGGVVEENLLTEADVIGLLKTKPVFTTKEVLAHFKKMFKAQPKNLKIIGGLLQSVANLVDGELHLKPGLE